MTNEERAHAIELHGQEHEKKMQRRRKARLARYQRNKNRGLQATINLMVAWLNTRNIT